MATALARGVSASGVIRTDLLDFCEPCTAQQATLSAQFPGCQVTDRAELLFNACPRIILAVKPQVLREIVGQIRPLIQAEHLLVSIVAGIPIKTLSDWLGTERIVRVMPNTPAQVLAGASGISGASCVSGDDLEWVRRVMSSVGFTSVVSEAQLHGLTGVSGSGPAYAAMMIEALADGGVAAGLPRELAIKLAAHTLLGTAKMVLETHTHPAVLKDQVASPAGTTIAAIEVLERGGFRSAVIQAVLAATERSRELAHAK
jgi:pyrroline-5-carboxylate reductase